MYVNNIILTGNDIEEIIHIINLLDQHFKIMNLSDLTFFWIEGSPQQCWTLQENLELHNDYYIRIKISI